MKLQRKLVLPIAGLLVLIVLAYLVWGGGDGDQSERYLRVEVQRGDVRRTVTSTGTLQAVVTVQVGSQVSGRIQELHADFNSVVKKGQTLAIIDPANFEAQRDRAAASLATAEASVKNAEANQLNRRAELLSSEANLEVTLVNQQEAGRQLRRAKGLFEDGLIPERDLETAQASPRAIWCAAAASRGPDQSNQGLHSISRSPKGTGPGQRQTGQGGTEDGPGQPLLYEYYFADRRGGDRTQRGHRPDGGSQLPGTDLVHDRQRSGQNAGDCSDR